MTDYTRVCYDVARRVTLAYSTSFGTASRLFAGPIRPHIYAIYAMVRIADEIVDTYDGADRADLLTAFETDVRMARASGYSTNPVIHAFVTTALKYGIDDEIVAPFFGSMRMDLASRSYDQETYERYIYGSAEVVGLMCLRVFVDGDADTYNELEDGARALGSAYQKVNFLRDIKSDFTERGRMYFPDVSFGSFDTVQKDAVVADIRRDFEMARPSIAALPNGSRRAVAVSYRYYNELLSKLARASVSDIKNSRIRIPDSRKLVLFAGAAVKGKA